MIDAPWLPCVMCGHCSLPGNDLCTCGDWLNAASRKRMEREVKARHLASVALAMSHVTIGVKAA